MNCVSYIRVSTQRQGLSGLGLEAQRQTIDTHLKTMGGVLVKEFLDVESGRKKTREGIKAAMEYCKKTNSRLIIAKLDRLSRDVQFIFEVVNSNIDVYFCDLPEVNTITLGVLSSFAQYESERISQRVKDVYRVRREKFGYNKSPESKEKMRQHMKNYYANMSLEEKWEFCKSKHQKKPAYLYVKEKLLDMIRLTGNDNISIQGLVNDLKTKPDDWLRKNVSKEWNTTNVFRLVERIKKDNIGEIMKAYEDYKTSMGL